MFVSIFNTTFITLAPAFFFIWLFTRKMQFTNRRFILLAIGCGALVTFPVLGSGTLWLDWFRDGQSGFDRTALRAFAVSGFTEEWVKYLVFVGLLVPRLPFLSPRNVVCLGGLVGLGFAAAENAVYVVNSGVTTAVLRSFTAIPCHGLLGAIMGMYVAKAIHQNERTGMIYALVVPTFLHAFYNFPLMAMQEEATFGSSAGHLSSFSIFVLGFMTLWVSIIFRKMERRKEPRLQLKIQARPPTIKDAASVLPHEEAA